MDQLFTPINTNIDTLISLVHNSIGYRPNLDYTDWEERMRMVVPDQHNRQLLQEFAGYIMAPTNLFQKFLVLEGTNLRKKKCITKMLTFFAGPNGVTYAPLEALCQSHALHALHGKRVCCAGEWGHMPLNAKLTFKSIVGGDPVTINPKYEKPFEAVLTTKFVTKATHWHSPDTSLSRMAQTIRIEPNNHDDFPKIDLHGVGHPRREAIAWAADGLKNLLNRGSFIQT